MLLMGGIGLLVFKLQFIGMKPLSLTLPFGEGGPRSGG